MGWASPAARRWSNWLRFSPACFWPVKNRAIWRWSTLEMMLVVKMPVRSCSPPAAAISLRTLWMRMWVIIVQKLALRGDADQGLVDDLGCFRGGLDQFPLRRSRQRNPEMILPFAGPIHRQAG